MFRVSRHADRDGDLAQRCTEVGALLILDEIQCGFGRTGTFWAFEQFGIEIGRRAVVLRGGLHGEVRREQRAIDLTQREFELLEYLMRNERIVVPRQRLLEEVWGYDPFATSNTIEVFVSNLRRKLEAGDEPRLLHTIRGAGYVLRA